MPLRNNILFVDNALKAYEYVNVDSEITRIFFAIAQASLLNDINKEIHKYLDALERGECREVLGIDFKKLTHKSYWKKGNRLPSDMMALKRKPLSEYGINCDPIPNTYYFSTNTDIPGRRPSTFSVGTARTSKVLRSYWPVALVAFQVAYEPISFI